MNLDQKVFRMQTNLAASETRHMSLSVLGTVLIYQAHKYITLKEKCVRRFKKSRFFCFMESGQPYYGIFMDSDRPLSEP